MKQFLIYESYVDDAGNLCITGVVNQGTIELGTCFTKALGAIKSDELPVEPESASVELCIREIDAYQQALSSLPEGWSGRLVVEGSGHERLTKGMMLCS